MANLIALILISVFFPLVVGVVTSYIVLSDQKDVRETALIPIIMLCVFMCGSLISTAVDINKQAIYSEAIAAEVSSR